MQKNTKGKGMIPSDIGLPNSPGVQSKYGVNQFGKPMKKRGASKKLKSKAGKAANKIYK